MNIEFLPLKEDDIPNLTAMMKRAFDKDTQEFLGKPEGGPPGYDNGEFIRKYGMNKDSDAYKVIMDGRTVGLIILWILENNHNYLGNLFVDSDIQDKGIGYMIWKKAEALYPDTVEWLTETPWFTRRNHNFYVNKCGFSIYEIDNPKSDEASYKMRKIMRKI